MTNIFSEIVTGFKWLGKEIVAVPTLLSRWVTLVDDVDGDADTVLPEVVTLFNDVDAVCNTAVKDSGVAISDAEALIAAITAAAEAKGANILEDETVVAAFSTFIGQVTTSSNYADLLDALKKLVTQYDIVGTEIKAAITKLEKDAK